MQRGIAASWPGVLACVALAAAGCGDEGPSAVGDDDITANVDIGNDTGSGPSDTTAGGCDRAKCPGPADGDPCQRPVCAAGKCALAADNGAACDDGDPCTKLDLCQGGACVGAVNACGGCDTDADCHAKDDGNPCNGTLICDKSGKSPVCKLAASTVVTCAPSTKPCLLNACDPATGKCNEQPSAEGAPCDDGDVCTVHESCASGACTSKYDSVCGCAKDSDCPDDGDKCNGVMFCDKEAKPWACRVNKASVVLCDKAGETSCEVNTCAPLSGQCTKTALADGTACDDGQGCTVGDGCKAGTCVSGTDICPCTSDADCAKHEDGNLCNGTLYCDKKSGECFVNPETIITCPSVDDTDCRTNTCQPKTGKCAMTDATDGKPCKDGQPCHGFGGCKAGKCADPKILCLCTTDAECDATFDDGNICNGTWFCDKGAKPLAKCAFSKATVVFCPVKDDSDCLKNTCAPKTGKCAMSPQPKGAPCDDGDACAGNDGCAAGKCAGQAIQCDDKNACTVDACDTAKGCQHAAKSCDDANVCTLDLCDTKTGQCSHGTAALAGKPCDADGSGCTVNDRCEAGVCKAGTPAACAGSGKACEVGACVPQGSDKFACVTVQAPDKSPCGDDQACSFGATCLKGACGPGTAQKLYSKVLPVPADNVPKATGAAFAAVAALGDGAALAVGRWHNAKGAGWFWQRLAANGKAAAAHFGPTQAAHAEVAATGVVAQGGGAAVLAGTIAKTGGGRSAQARALDNKDTLGWTWTATGTASSAGALASYLDGTLAVGGKTIVAAKTNGAVWRLSKAGALLSTYQGALGSVIEDVAFLADGTVVAAGSGVTGDAKPAGQLARISAAGKALWSRSWGAAEGGGFHAVAASPTGGALVSGSRTIGKAQRGWQLHIGGDGKALWDRQDTAAFIGRSIARQGLPLADPAKQRFVVAGLAEGGQNAENAWFSQWDGFGNRQWSETGAEAGRRLSGVAEVAADIVVAVGAAQVGAETQPLVIRADAHGHSSCSAAAGCYGKPANACDDGNPCTIDACGVKGCAHVAAAGLACDVSDGCTVGGVCSAGACKPSDKQRLYSKLLEAPVVQEAVSIAQGKDSSLSVAGLGNKRLQVTHLDAHGQLVSNKQSQGTADTFEVVGGVVHLADGAIVALINRTSSPYQCDLVRFDTNLKAVAEAKIYTGSIPQLGCVPVNVVPLQGGAKLAVFYHRGIGGNVYWSSRDTQTLAGIKESYALPTGNKSYYPWAHGEALADGTLLMTGYRRSGGIDYGGASRVDSLDKGNLWSRNVLADKPFTSTQIVGGTIAPSGGLFLVGQASYTGVIRPFMVHERDDGKRLWQWTGALSDTWLPRQVIAGPGQLLTVISSEPVGGGGIGIRQFDGLGGVMSQRLLLAPGQALSPAEKLAAVVLADGGLAVLGGATSKGQKRMHVTRLDKSGHSSCAAAGKACADPEKWACDDQNACTLDTCDAKLGCQHAKAKCDDGKQCTNDVCDPAKGCQHPPKKCDDNNVCTLDDCTETKGCQHRPNPCSDGQPCTKDSCDKAKGCQHEAMADGAKCSEGGCTWNKCGGGKCTKGYADLTLPGCSAKTAVQRCADLPRPGPKGISGTYWLDPDEGGPVQPFQGYCDMETDGGGWLLLYNFSQEQGKALPKNGVMTPGPPPTKTTDYARARADSLGIAEDEVRQVRLYCQTSNHSRVVHFKTDNPWMRRAVWDDKVTYLHASDWSESATLLSGHSANIPKQIGWVHVNYGTGLVIRAGVADKVHEWRLYRGSGFWAFACDDGHKHGGSIWPKWSHHRVWIR